MLPRAGFGDDAALAHSPSEQNLTQRVVNLMCAGMQQILAFQVNLRAAEMGGRIGSRVVRPSYWIGSSR